METKLYIKNPNDPKGPLKSLQGFKRTHIAAGETQTISFELTPKAFWSFNDETQTMEVRPGKYEILYGPSSADKDLKSLTLTIE